MALVSTAILSPEAILPVCRCSAARRDGLLVVPTYFVLPLESLIEYWTVLPPLICPFGVLPLLPAELSALPDDGRLLLVDPRPPLLLPYLLMFSQSPLGFLPQS